MQSLQALIAIFGSSYCGSTLLNAMLNSHSRICGGGELHWCVKGKGNTCAICGERCQYWTAKVRSSITAGNLYETTASLFQKPVVADTSKMPLWFSESLPLHASLPMSRVILVKHPVRTVASFVEKARRFPYMAEYADVTTTISHLRYLYKYATDRFHFDFVIRYEDLVGDPEATLRGLLGVHQLGFEPAMLNWEKASQHYIGGNAGPRFQAARHIKPDGKFLERKYQETGLFLDNTYSEILDEAAIETVLNHPDGQYLLQKFGYGDLSAGCPANRLPPHAPLPLGGEAG